MTEHKGKQNRQGISIAGGTTKPGNRGKKKTQDLGCLGGKKKKRRGKGVDGGTKRGVQCQTQVKA